MKKNITILLCFVLTFGLVSCKGIEFENQKIAKAEEFTKGEAMIFVAEEKNKYENRFTEKIWNLKSGDGSLFFKDYILSVTKSFVEEIMVMKLIAEDLNIIIGNVEEEKIEVATKEYYNLLTVSDLEYMQCNESDIYNAFKDYHIARLVIDNLSKNANTELSISEAKVIKVQYIRFDDEEKAQKTYDDLKAKGAVFSYFAKTRSLDTDIEMTIKRGDETSTHFPELFYLSNGQTSEILKFRNNFFIFKCINDYLVDETESRRLEVLKAMKNNEFTINYDKYKSEYNIRSNSPYWREIDLQNGNYCTINKFEEIYYSHFPKNIK